MWNNLEKDDLIQNGKNLLFVCGFLALQPQIIRKSLCTVAVMTVMPDFVVSLILSRYLGGRNVFIAVAETKETYGEGFLNFSLPSP